MVSQTPTQSLMSIWVHKSEGGGTMGGGNNRRLKIIEDKNKLSPEGRTHMSESKLKLTGRTAVNLKTARNSHYTSLLLWVGV